MGLAPALLLGGSDEWLAVDGTPFPSENWKWEDGCLRTIAGLTAFQDLRSRQEFIAVEFTFEWKLAMGANSGVKYHIEKVDVWRAPDGKGFHKRGRGPEFQLADDEREPHAIEDARCATGGLYGKLAPEKRTSRPAGTWNDARLVSDGLHVEHWVNGIRVLAYQRDTKALPGPIVLQHHNSEAWFRNMRLERR